MIELNLITLVYLFLRLSPFIIVCFFALNSLFNQDFRGMVYLHGLIFCCAVSTMIYNAIGMTFLFSSGVEKKSPVCTLVSFSKEPTSAVLPIGQNILGFTFFYLFYVIAKHNTYTVNIVSLVFFPILIVSDFIWNTINSCYDIGQLVLSLILGAGFGTLLSFIIDSTGIVSLQYFYSANSAEQCSVPSNQTFKCSVYKNGALIASTTQ
jgi:hypothetical protein